MILGGSKDTGLTKLAREVFSRVVHLLGFDELMDATPCEIQEVYFALCIFAPTNDAISGAC